MSAKVERTTLNPDAQPGRRSTHAQPDGFGVECERVEVVAHEQVDAESDAEPTVHRHDAQPAAPPRGQLSVTVQRRSMGQSALVLVVNSQHRRRRSVRCSGTEHLPTKQGVS